MATWRQKGVDCSIYSSGSVFAQKLLFGHIRDTTGASPHTSSEGQNASATTTVDRTDAIQMWFDTTNAGPKTERASYETIAHGLGTEAGKVLFLSDNVREVSAALEAGMKAIVVDRPGNAELAGREREEYEVVTSFDQIKL